MCYVWQYDETVFTTWRVFIFRKMSVRLSIRLSHARILSKRLRTLHIYHQTFSLSGSHTILVFLYQTVWQNPTRTPHPNGGVECKGVIKCRHFRPITRFISEMIQVRPIVTKKGEYETVPKLSNGAFSNYLEWPLTYISRSRYYWTLNNSKWCKIELYLQWPTSRKSCMICRTAQFWMTLDNP